MKYDRNEACSSEFDLRSQWFAAWTIPRHEKRVQESLTERGIETFLPLYQATRQWKKSRPVVLDLPLFPTYVFIRISRMAQGSVLRTPGVVSIVGSPRQAWSLPDSDMEALRRGTKTRKLEPHAYLRLGERMRIKAGVLAGVEGILVRKKNEYRVVLSLDAIMRSVAVEVDLEDIETASPIPVC